MTTALDQASAPENLPIASRSAASVSRRVFRDGDWLTEERVRTFTRLWLAMSVITAVVWTLLSRHGVDLLGKPIGTDFSSFWTASQTALGGHPARIYDSAAHVAAETKLFGRDVGNYAYFYPPVFPLICLPLALAPYLASLGLWLGVTGLAYARTVRAFGGGRIGWVAILSFPAVLINAGHGQNGFLSAALFGGGVILLNRRPLLAGVLLGCLVYKPHLGLVLPLALLAAGRWRSILGAALAVIGLCGLSLAAFGAATWRGFFAGSAMARMTLEQNLVGNEKLQSVFAAVRLLHGGLGLAYGAQAVVAVCVCGLLVRAQTRAFRAEAEGPALVAATLLVSPFLLDYDLILLAIPIAWLADQGLRTGFRSWEKTILAAAFLLPALSRTLAGAASLPVGPIVVGAVFWLILRRWTPPASQSPAGPVGESRLTTV